jgi:hypothetical protein
VTVRYPSGQEKKWQNLEVNKVHDLKP